MAGHTINDDLLDAVRRSSALAATASEPTNGPDSLEGSESRDTISLLSGNDTYSALGGSDLIYGNQGRDLIYGNDGRDTVFGGQDADTVYGGADANKLYGNLGDDRLFGERGNDLVYGNEGRDQLFGGDGRDTLYGGQDDDVLEGGAGDDSIVGGRGDDTAVFSGTRASYTITKNRDGSFTLDGASGRDHVETVENFRFDDGTFDASTLLTGDTGSGGGDGFVRNRAPSGTDTTVTFNEDTSVTLSQANFGFSDAADPSPDSFRSVIITTLPVTGNLTLSGTAVTAEQEVTAAQLSAGQLVYTPVADGDQDTSFTFQVRDNGGTVGGGTDTDQSPNTLTLDITPVLDAPVVATSNNTLAYTENQAPTAIDPAVSVSDVDGKNLIGATVQITDNFVKGEDRLTLNGFPVTSTVDADGYYQIITAGYEDIFVKFDTEQGSVTFKGFESHERYEDVLRSVSYSNSSDAPSTALRTVTFTATDEDNLTSLGASDAIQITPVNDTPVATTNTYTTNEDTPLVIPVNTGVLANDGDVDGDRLRVGSYAQPQHGSLTLNLDGSFNYIPNANYNGADSFAYTATDGMLSSAPATVNLSITPINDEPQAIPDSNSYP